MLYRQQVVNGEATYTKHAYLCSASQMDAEDIDFEEDIMPLAQDLPLTPDMLVRNESWDSHGTGIPGDACGSPRGSGHALVFAGAGVRELVSNPLNTEFGGSLVFWLRY